LEKILLLSIRTDHTASRSHTHRCEQFTTAQWICYYSAMSLFTS